MTHYPNKYIIDFYDLQAPTIPVSSTMMSIIVDKLCTLFDM